MIKSPSEKCEKEGHARDSISFVFLLPLVGFLLLLQLCTQQPTDVLMTIFYHELSSVGF
jgi:hypothetical protein